MHSPLFTMTIKVRLALLLGVLLVAFLAVLQILRVWERRQEQLLERESLDANVLTIKQWINLSNEPLRRFAHDYARWESVADFVVQHDLQWADRHLGQNLKKFSAHALWVLDRDGKVVYTAQAHPGPPLAPPVNKAEVITLQNRTLGGSFFAESREGLLEVWSEALTPDTSPQRVDGYLLVARLWNDDHLASLGKLAELDLFLTPADQLHDEPAPLALRDANGRPLRHLVMRQRETSFREGLARDAAAGYLFVSFGLLMVTALWLAVRVWILRPLDQIGQSLAQNNPAPIRPLLSDRSELGRIAQLIESSFLQKSSLTREIDERKRTELALRDSEAQVRHSLELRGRLARDLHDGVIQSIYAAGLGLESATSQLDKDPEGVRSRLQLCRQSLNDVIREVRGFINGIEPDEMHPRGFAQELSVLTRTMQALWSVQIAAQVDPAVAARLGPVQEINAIQICRESISNAVRHGKARSLELSLEVENGAGVLKVRDDGCGFDLAVGRGSGSGLGNLETRAAEMGGTLHLHSKPGQGCLVTVTFPLGPFRA
jgi:signal transduction histidine kinase